MRFIFIICQDIYLIKCITIRHHCTSPIYDIGLIVQRVLGLPSILISLQVYQP